MQGDQHNENDAEQRNQDEADGEHRGDREHRDPEDRDDDVEQMLEEAAAFFVAEDERTEPVSDADAPPPG